MKINSIAQTLITIDTYSDLLPVVSTLTNLVDLFIKTVIKTVGLQKFGNNRYIKYLDSKSYQDCLFLLVPGVGNFVIYKKRNESENQNEELKKNATSEKEITENQVSGEKKQIDPNIDQNTISEKNSNLDKAKGDATQADNQNQKPVSEKSAEKKSQAEQIPMSFETQKSEKEQYKNYLKKAMEALEEVGSQKEKMEKAGDWIKKAEAFQTELKPSPLTIRTGIKAMQIPQAKMFLKSALNSLNTNEKT